MQLKNHDSELIKEEIFVRIYQLVLQGEIKDSQVINSVYNYFYRNPDQLFKLYYQKEKPVENPYKYKNCYSCGQKGHIKRNCKTQGLTEEEEIEFVFQKPIEKGELIIKQEVHI